MEEEKSNFIRENSPKGGFLQSDKWRKFQEAVGRRTYCITGEDFHASLIKHTLPIVGSYLYIPRGPVMQVQSSKFKVQSFFDKIIDLAKKENVGWIRIEVDYKNVNYKITKALHDMQPREVLIVDITKKEEELLAEMKSKTRYNIKLSQKRGVSVKVLTNNQQLTTNNFFDKFIELVKVTAKRDGITPHPENYYRKIFKTIPAENLKLYVAEYNDKVITANIIIYYGNTATYLHGASDNEYRNVMAPYLLQWQAILDAKKAGLEKYDLGGIKTDDNNSWAGITKFKTGFSPDTKPVEFPGSYDIVINPVKYNLYRIIQKIKSIL